MVSDEFGQRIIGIFAKGDTIVDATDKHPAVFAKDGDGKYDYLTLSATGLVVDVASIVSVTVTASSLDIRAIAAPGDSIAVSDGTYTLAINSDGSINVVTSDSSPDSVYLFGDETAEKDTPVTVLSQSPGADQYMSYLKVSAAGMCYWRVWYGTTSSEAVIMSFWTTPSHPTETVDFPDYKKVLSTETIYITAENKEKAASPASDFLASATLIRKV